MTTPEHNSTSDAALSADPLHAVPAVSVQDRGPLAGVAAATSLLVLSIGCAAWMMLDLFLNPPVAENFLPFLLPTVWPVAPIVGTLVVGPVVYAVALKMPSLRERLASVSVPIVAGLTVGLFVLAWPILFRMNAGG